MYRSNVHGLCDIHTCRHVDFRVGIDYDFTWRFRGNSELCAIFVGGKEK